MATQQGRTENITALLSWHGKAASKADMVIAQLELFVSANLLDISQPLRYYYLNQLGDRHGTQRHFKKRRISKVGS